MIRETRKVDGILPEDLKRFDRVHPGHVGCNTVHATRVQVANWILTDGYHRVLDVPAGTGALSCMLLAHGIDVVSADLCPEAFLVSGKPCIRADLNERLPFDDGTFDAVACIEGIEHIENPHLLAREANRILRPGGKIYISTPNILSIRSRLSILFRGYPDQFHYMIELDPTTGREQPIAHINPIGLLELRYVLSRWGFRMDRLEANRQVKKWSWLSQALRAVLLTRGGRSAAVHSRIAAVRAMLLSDAALFGEGLMVSATKETDWRAGAFLK